MSDDDTTIPEGVTPPGYRAALDAAHGLADVEVAGLPVEAQAGWARMARPVLRELVAWARPAIDPPGDARLGPVVARLRAVRVQLDRVDDAVELLARDLRVSIGRHTTALRVEVDSLEAAIERAGAGL